MLVLGVANVGITTVIQMDNKGDLIFFPSVLHIIYPYKIFGKWCMSEVDGNNLRSRIIKRLERYLKNRWI